MAENETSMDFDGDSDSGVVTGSDSQSVCIEATLIGSPTPSVHGDEAIPHQNFPTGGTTQQTNEVSSASSGFHSGGTEMNFPQQTPGIVHHQHGSQAGDSGIFSLQSGKGDQGFNTGQLGSKLENVTLPDNQDSAKSTQEWLEKHFDVFVKTLEGKTLTIQASADEEVTSFRAKVDQRTGVPGTQQRLTSQTGYTLEDGKSLRDYQIRKHSTIYCQGRLRGGFL